MIERYSTPEMSEIWSDVSKLRRWLEIELLATEAHAELGIVPADDAAACRDRAPVVDERFVAAVLEREAITDHDVAAFVDVVQAAIGDAGKWIHYGLTSSDVGDTALCWQMRDAADAACSTPPRHCWRRVVAHGARASRHRDDRAHARRARRADHVRSEGRVVGAPDRPRPHSAARRPRHRGGDEAQRCGRDVLEHPARRRSPRRCRARSDAGAGDTGDRPRPSRRVPVRLRVDRADVRAGGGRAAPPPAHRGGRGAGGVQARSEGLVGDAAQAQPDLGRDDLRPRTGRAFQPARRPAGRRLVARARHLALVRRTRRAAGLLAARPLHDAQADACS